MAGVRHRFEILLVRPWPLSAGLPRSEPGAVVDRNVRRSSVVDPKPEGLVLPDTANQRVWTLSRVGMLFTLPIQLGTHHLATWRVTRSLRL